MAMRPHCILHGTRISTNLRMHEFGIFAWHAKMPRPWARLVQDENGERWSHGPAPVFACHIVFIWWSSYSLMGFIFPCTFLADSGHTLLHCFAYHMTSRYSKHVKFSLQNVPFYPWWALRCILSRLGQVWCWRLRWGFYPYVNIMLFCVPGRRECSWKGSGLR